MVWDAVEGHRFVQSTYYNRTRYYRSTHYNTSVCFAADGNAFAVGEGGTVEMHRMDGRLLWQEPHAHEDYLGFSDIGTTVVFSPSSPLLVSGGRDGAVCLWDALQGRCIARLQDKAEPVTTLAFSPDGRSLAVGDTEGSLRIWNVAGRTLERTLRPSPPSEITCLAYTPDGRLLIAGHRDGSITTWSTEGSVPLDRLRIHKKPVKAVSVSPDGRILATAGDDADVLLWDLDAGVLLRRFEGHENWVEAAAFSPDGSFLATGGKDGTLRLWNASSGREILKFVNLEFYDWLAVTPEGDLNASPNAAQYIRIGVESRRYPLEHIFTHCYRPDVIRRVLAERALPPPETESVDELGPPPMVEIRTPRTDKESMEARIPVIVLARDTGEGIASLSLFHNGRRVVREQGDRGIALRDEPGLVRQRFEVQLARGENRFRAVAVSKKGVESEWAEKKIVYRRSREETDLHVLAVGIDAYRNPDLTLDYAESDARGVAEFFRSRQTGLFRTVHVIQMLGRQATAEAIRGALKHIGEDARPQDAVLLYFCGHGETLDGTWYFLPQDLVFPERRDRLKALGISSDELAEALQRIRARKVLLAMDSCKSGAALLSFRGVENRMALMQLARANGVYVIAASSREQSAAEVRELGHGVFTYTLLRGLRGEAAQGEQSPVTVKRLLAYVEEQLPLLSQKHHRRPQYPVVYSIGMDFPLALAESSSRATSGPGPSP